MISRFQDFKFQQQIYSQVILFA
uniref:Uncharacterized protein n=1 Tax=Rhizophora mucronata TaxID=61149 RepID=A0A2P2QY67_RHIMU